jgi:hypothetical protein
MIRKQSWVPTETGVGVEAMPLATTVRFHAPGGMPGGTCRAAVTVALPVAIPRVEKSVVRRYCTSPTLFVSRTRG